MHSHQPDREAVTERVMSLPLVEIGEVVDLTRARQFMLDLRQAGSQLWEHADQQVDVVIDELRPEWLRNPDGTYTLSEGDVLTFGARALHRGVAQAASDIGQPLALVRQLEEMLAAVGPSDDDIARHPSANGQVHGPTQNTAQTDIQGIVQYIFDAADTHFETQRTDPNVPLGIDEKIEMALRSLEAKDIRLANLIGHQVSTVQTNEVLNKEEQTEELERMLRLILVMDYVGPSYDQFLTNQNHFRAEESVHQLEISELQGLEMDDEVFEAVLDEIEQVTDVRQRKKLTQRLLALLGHHEHHRQNPPSVA